MTIYFKDLEVIVKTSLIKLIQTITTKIIDLVMKLLLSLITWI